MRQTSAEVGAATEVATKLTKEAVEKEGADVGKEVAKRIEKGLSASNTGDLVDGWARMITESQDVMWTQEAKIRKEMGIRTIFNILGPLCNPALANHQLLGVYKPSLTLL